MKKTQVITILIIAISCSLLSAGKSNARSANIPAEDALALMNHVNWVVSKIITTESQVALETEYEGISADGLYLDCIHDEEIVRTIKQVMRTIANSRLNEMERKLLYDSFEREKKNLIYNAIPNPIAVVNPNLRSVAINLTVASLTGYMRYKQSENELKNRLEKEDFRLDKDRIIYLNDLSETLLEEQCNLVEKHNLDDRKRLTVKQLVELNKMLNDNNDGNENRIYDYLQLNEEIFKCLPQYWYLRGIYAEKNHKEKDEFNSYLNFQKIYRPFLRNDQMAASVSMNLCKIYLKESGNEANAKIEKQLDLIEARVEPKDWEFFYFCGLVYWKRFNNLEKAFMCLKKVVNVLECKFSDDINNFYKKMSEYEDEEWQINHFNSFNSNILALCREQLFNIILERKIDSDIIEFFKNEISDVTLSAFEFFSFFTPEKLIACQFLEYFQSTSLLRAKVKWGRNDEINIFMPMRLFYGEKKAPIVKFLSKGKLIRIADYGTDFERTKLHCVILEPSDIENLDKTAYAMACQVNYELDVMKEESIDCIDLEFCNAFHTIVVRYLWNYPIVPQGLTESWIKPTHVIADGKTFKLEQSYLPVSDDDLLKMVKKGYIR